MFSLLLVFLASSIQTSMNSDKILITDKNLKILRNNGAISADWYDIQNEVEAIETDSTGNVYITGGIDKIGGSDLDLILLKYNSSGVQLWNRTWGGLSTDKGREMIFDSLDNIIILGETLSFGSTCLVKFNPSGFQIWNYTWSGFYLKSIAIDSLDDIYVIGETEDYNVSLIKFNNSGVQLWNRTWGGLNMEEVQSIVVDSLNIYIAGYTESFGAGNRDVFLVKYNTSGVQQWNYTWGGINADYLTFGSWGNSLIYFSGNLYLTGATGSYGAGPEDVFLLKFNSSGILQWNCTWGGIMTEYPWDFKVDSNENIYITGQTESFGNGGGELFLIKYNNSGVQIWNRTWGTTGLEEGFQIFFDSLDRINVVGLSQPLSIGEICIVGYNSSGFLEYEKVWGGFLNPYPFYAAMDDKDNIYVAGIGFLVKFSIDSDEDILSDWEELNLYSTNPYNNDTDSDTMLDGWEVFNTLNPLIDDSGDDPDFDSLFNLYEFTNNTNPNDADTDSDTMLDGWEVFNSLDPLIDDSGGDPDFDSLTNVYEYINNTDPNNPDSDNDGLSDGEEIITYSTNPLNNDTDIDGINDGEEVNGSKNQFNGQPTNPNDADSDNDGLTDVVECTGTGNPYGGEPTNPNDADTDGDELDDSQEIIYSTNPNDFDTDNDGFSDGYEVRNGFNPRNSFSNPTMNIIIIAIVVSVSLALFVSTLIAYPRVKKKIVESKKLKQQEKEKLRKIEEARDKIELEKLEKEKLEKISIIRKTTLDLSTKYTRLNISEISEFCGISEDSLIIGVIQEMIENKDLYAHYFASTKSIAFDQQANIDEIDKLMDQYRQWEKKGIGKK